MGVEYLCEVGLARIRPAKERKQGGTRDTATLDDPMMALMMPHSCIFTTHTNATHVHAYTTQSKELLLDVLDRHPGRQRGAKASKLCFQTPPSRSPF
jgi:hypothetical protein